MAKRLHDTDVWRGSWFRSLTPQSKLLWFYLLDACNCAGIVEIDDLEQISFFIGVKITVKHFEELKKQLLTIDQRRVLILDFVDFQYGFIHDGHKMRKKVFAELAKFDIKYPIDTLSSIADTVKDKDKDMVKDIKEGVQGESWRDNSPAGFKKYLEISEPEFDRLYTDWAWIAGQKRFFPGCSVKRTLDRMWEQFWGTEAGWKNKRDAARGKKDYTIDWKATIERNFKKSICYYGKNEIDDEAEYLKTWTAHQ